MEKPGVFRTKGWTPVTYWTIPDSEKKLKAWVGVSQNSNCQSNTHTVALVSRYRLVKMQYNNHPWWINTQ